MSRYKSPVKEDVLKKKSHWKFFCPYCFYSGKGITEVCIKCKNPVLEVNHKLRFPSSSASKNRWKKFIETVGLFNHNLLGLPVNEKQILKTLETK
jgi:pyruvate/2-oxoglutarate/acetoin dehydrogenase E1 component